MTTIDIVLLFITLVAMFAGFMRGFMRQLGTVAGLVLGVVACRVFGDDVAAWFIGPDSAHPDAIRMLAYAGLFVVVFLASTLIGRLLKAVLKAVCLGFLDRVAGALFSAAVWLFLTSIALNVYLVAEPEQSGLFKVPSKPWREAVVDFAPAALGYVVNSTRV